MCSRLVLILSALLAFGMTLPVHADEAEGKSSGLTISTDALASVERGTRERFRAGEEVEFSFDIRNAGENPQLLRRIAFMPSPGLLLRDPAEDGIDNDDDGLTDEADEAFRGGSRRNGIWRIGRGDSVLAPGETARRRIRAMLEEDTMPGGRERLGVSIGASERAEGTNRPRRWRHVVTIPLEAPQVIASAPAEIDLDLPRALPLRFDVSLPAGVIPEAGLRLEGLERLNLSDAPELLFGDAVICERVERSAAEEGVFQWALGRCTIDTGEAAGQRISVTASGIFRDAPRNASAAEVADWRQMEPALTLLNEGDPLAQAGTEIRAGGAFVVSTLRSRSEGPLSHERPLEVEYAVENRGDRPFPQFRVALDPEAPFDCGRAQMHFDATVATFDPETCLGRQGPRLGLMPGQVLGLTLRLPLRRDARLEGGPSIPGWIVTREASRSTLDPVSLEFPPVEPFEIVAVPRQLTTKGLIRRRPGEILTIVARGAFPRGRYDGMLRLFARLVDAENGEPRGPAPLSPRQARLVLGGESLPVSLVRMPQEQSGVWARYEVPLDLGEIGNPDERRRVAIEVSLQLDDLPELAAGTMLEVNAETVAYGTDTVPSLEWVEALIVEPELRVRLTSFDDDRTLDVGDGLRVMGVVCNQGNAAAHGVVLRLDMPKDGRVERPAEQGETPWIFARRLKPAESVERPDSPAALYSSDRKLVLPVTHRDASIRAVVLGPQGLPPSECATLVVDGATVPLEARDAEGLPLRFSVEPFQGLTNGAGRVYPGISSPVMMFDTPVVAVAPRSNVAAERDGAARHVVTVRIPEMLGAVTADLGFDSSAGLGWSAFIERTDGSVTPWENGRNLPAGETLSLAFETKLPESTPLGWNDTTIVRLRVVPDEGFPHTVKTRLITVPHGAANAAIHTTRRMALDRDCDGELQDERVAEATFEQAKDIAIGECAAIRIYFRHDGTRAVERIAIRDVLPAQVSLIEGSIAVERSPDDDAREEITVRDLDRKVIEWNFKGLFQPGSWGEVGYSVRLDDG